MLNSSLKIVRARHVSMIALLSFSLTRSSSISRRVPKNICKWGTTVGENAVTAWTACEGALHSRGLKHCNGQLLLKPRRRAVCVLGQHQPPPPSTASTVAVAKVGARGAFSAFEGLKAYLNDQIIHAKSHRERQVAHSGHSEFAGCQGHCCREELPPGCEGMVYNCACR